ncbi:MAG: FMN-binding protein [Acutalibacteraceae bacterium]|nr:FMN-binding protein [Acutalibacteraceae bacterium]
MNKHMKSVISLTAICAAVSLLLAVTNYVTAPIIEKQQSAAANEALYQVMPDGEDFQAVDLTKYELPDSITEAYSEKNGGYVFKITTTGYSSGFIIMCGVDASGTVTGATYIASSETLGEEATYGEKLKGATLDTVESVETVSGATKTTSAYRNAVKDSLGAAVILGGGSVDLRSDEEILNDNLSAALPSAEGKFTSVFITEELTDINSVYKAENGAGYVFVSGESFIATDNEGNVTSETELKDTVETNAKKLIASTLTEIDISGYADMPSQVQKAYKTASGNYVFDLRAAGYGINGDKYTASGEYIYIKVSATADGKIIACETVSQKESDGIGSACADSSFYTQFNGKTADTYKDIDAISGATVTTNGYTTAISKVFEAINILKGGA